MAYSSLLKGLSWLLVTVHTVVIANGIVVIAWWLELYPCPDDSSQYQI